MTQARRIATLALLTMLPFVACGGEAERGASRTDPGSGANAGWRVRIGSHGGFTGGGDGHVVHSDGRVQAWSQITPQDSIALRDEGRASAEALKALREAMTDPALVSLTHRETGNMTGFLEWIEGGTMRQYSWAERAGEPGLPVPLARALAAARAAVASARE